MAGEDPETDASVRATLRMVESASPGSVVTSRLIPNTASMELLFPSEAMLLSFVRAVGGEGYDCVEWIGPDVGVIGERN